MLQQFVLTGVGVLVFIDQHMTHLGLPTLAHLRVVTQQLQGQTDQVIKVHALIRREPFFIAGHDACQ